MASEPTRITAAEYRAMVGKPAAKKPHKYGAIPTTHDGIWFASKFEAARYLQLKQLVRARVIFDLVVQPRFDLFARRDPGACIGKPERKVGTYVGDFRYCEGGLDVVEDTKGVVTPLYALKRKIFQDNYPAIVFREIKR